MEPMKNIRQPVQTDSKQMSVGCFKEGYSFICKSE